MFQKFSEVKKNTFFRSEHISDAAIPLVAKMPTTLPPEDRYVTGGGYL